jgi:hypothetical protein
VALSGPSARAVAHLLVLRRARSRGAAAGMAGAHMNGSRIQKPRRPASDRSAGGSCAAASLASIGGRTYLVWAEACHSQTIRRYVYTRGREVRIMKKYSVPFPDRLRPTPHRRVGARDHRRTRRHHRADPVLAEPGLISPGVSLGQAPISAESPPRAPRFPIPSRPPPF